MSSSVNSAFTIFFLLLHVLQVRLVDQCSIDECCADSGPPENKYSKAANTKYILYMKNIQDALDQYKPECEQKNCNCHLSTLKADLEPFVKTGISKAIFELGRKRGTKYQIIKGKVYRQKECLFPARCSGIEHFLLQLAPRMPDLEMTINTRDWPQVQIHQGPTAPVFSFSKMNDYLDIMYPAWSFWEGGPAIKLYPTGLGRWQQHRTSITQAATKWPWDKKKSMAFFRGSRTSDQRDPIVLLSRTRPDLVDAQYTKNQAWKSDADTLYAPPAEEVPLEDHCQYKYLFNYRGVAASFRFKHLFLCKALVFHVGDQWLEFFYPSLKPWVHYVPVPSDAKKEDLQEMIEFFKEHDNLAREMANRGYHQIWDHLRIADVKCYWKKLLKSYAELLTYEVTRDKELMEITSKK